MQSCGRCPTFCIVAHGHKREAARTAGLSIVYDTDLSYSAKLFENVLKISFGRVERQVSNIKLHSLNKQFVIPWIANSRAVPEDRISNHHREYLT
jgi:hypothetical protein